MGVHTLRSYYMTPTLLNPSLKTEGDFLGQHAICNLMITLHMILLTLSLHIDKGNTIDVLIEKSIKSFKHHTWTSACVFSKHRLRYKN
jgi:hypothetical protein